MFCLHAYVNIGMCVFATILVNTQSDWFTKFTGFLMNDYEGKDGMDYEGEVVKHLPISCGASA